MTDLYGNYQSQQTRGLQRIDSTKYPDTNEDFEANMRRLNNFVDYISQYLQQMQKGVDQATQDPISNLRNTITNLGIMLGGGELLYGIDLGDLQYYLPALAAMFGFDSSTPFPLNLFEAVEHFFLGYVVPLDSWNFAVEGIIDGWMVALGLNQDFIDAVHLVLDNMGRFTGDLMALFNDTVGLLGVFNIFDPLAGPIGPLWAALSSLLSNFNIENLGQITDPFLETLTPWLNAIGQILGVVDDFLEAIDEALGGDGAGGEGTGGFSNISNWLTDLLGMFGGFVGLGTGNPSILDPTNIPLLGPFISSMLGGLGLSGSGGLGGLITGLGNLLNSGSSIFSGNLFGQIGAGLLGNVSASHLAAISPNLIIDGSFNTAASLVGDAVWSWDSTLDHTGTPGSGSAKVIANGIAKDLSSDLIPVAQGQVLAGSGWVMWSALTRTGGANPINLSLTAYRNTGTQAAPVWAVVGTPDFATDTSGLSGSGWRQLSGSYTVPANVDAVRMRCHIDATATGGQINWDDLSLTKTQPIPTSMVGGLDGLLAGFASSVSDIFSQLNLRVLADEFEDAIITLTGGLGHSLTDIQTWVSSLLNVGSTLNANNIGAGAVNLTHLPDVQSILDGIGAAVAGLFGGGITHTQMADVMTQQTNALIGAQAQVQQLQASVTAASNLAIDTFNRNGSIGSNWAAIPVGSNVQYPHSGSGSQTCDGNNLAWVVSGNTPHTKLLRWLGPGQHSATDFQKVSCLLASQGQNPLIGSTSYNHLLARVSDDGLNYVRGQFSAYAGDGDDIQLFYCIGGVETNFYVGGFSPVVGAGSAIDFYAGVKGGNARSFVVAVNNNPFLTVTESGAVSLIGPSFRGYGVGQSAGNNIGIFPFLQQAKPALVNQWSGIDQ